MKRPIVKRMSMKPSLRSSHSGTMPERWDLSHLLKNPTDDFETHAKDLDSKVSRFESFRDSLKPEIASQSFQEILSLNEDIAAVSAKLGAYSYLWFSEDTKIPQARAFKT